MPPKALEEMESIVEVFLADIHEQQEEYREKHGRYLQQLWSHAEPPADGKDEAPVEERAPQDRKDVRTFPVKDGVEIPVEDARALPVEERKALTRGVEVTPHVLALAETLPFSFKVDESVEAGRRVYVPLRERRRARTKAHGIASMKVTMAVVAAGVRWERGVYVTEGERTLDTGWREKR